jgi:DNA-binding transcriptional regulator YbjK
MTKGIARERIVAAALELLENQGMDALTVRALATPARRPRARPLLARAQQAGTA